MILLVANIGNRNIIYKGQKINPAVFRSATKELLENFDREKEHLVPAIINDALDEFKKLGISIQKIELLASDQEGVYNNQDTLYEAQILKKLLTESYDVEVTYQTFNKNVADFNSMITAYRPYFIQLLKLVKDGYIKKIYYLDAGGTSQQKFASKILLEYLFDKGVVSVYYIDPPINGQPSSLRDSDPREYRKIIDKENIAIAVSVNGYNAALGLFHGGGLAEYNQLKPLLEFMDYRFQNMSDLCISSMANLKKNLLQLPFVKSYYKNKKEGKPLGSTYHDFKDVISEDDFSVICELYAIAQRYLHLKNYSQACLYYSIFIENYLYASIKHQLKIDLVKDYEKSFNKLGSVLLTKFKGLFPAFYPNIELTKSVPALIKVCWIINEGEANRSMLSSFMKVNSVFNKPLSRFFDLLQSNPSQIEDLKNEEFFSSYCYEKNISDWDGLKFLIPCEYEYNTRFRNGINGFVNSKSPMQYHMFLDSLRNSYAHKAKSVSRDFPTFIYFHELIFWGQLLGMPERNIYEEMNNEFIELLN